MLVALLALSLSACSSGSSSSGSGAASEASGGRVSGSEAARLVQEENATLLDVRTPGEFSGGHVEGAVNIPVGDLGGRVSEVDQDRPVVVYCQSGGRSASAAELLRGRGYTVHDMGAMSAWPSQ